MLYNLRNGSTVFLSVERYLDMTDDEIEKLEMYYIGAEVNDPFFASVLEDPTRKEKIPERKELDYEELYESGEPPEVEEDL